MSASSSSDFENAASRVKTLAKSPDNDELLQLYGLYKQATMGDNTASKPWLDLKARAKWDSWEARKGMTTDDARNEYIALVGEMVDKYGCE